MPSIDGMLISLMARRISGLAPMRVSACSAPGAVRQGYPFDASTELTSSSVGGSSSIARIRIFVRGMSSGREPAPL